MLYMSKRILFNNRFKNFLSRYVCQVVLSKKSRVNMEKAYFRYTEGDDHFHLSFLFKNNVNNVERQFNLTRRKDETVGGVLSRISNNVEKVLNKKKKKPKKGETVENEPNPIQVKLTQHGRDVPEEDLCLDVLRSSSNTNLHVVDVKFDILLNAPWVLSMALPTSMLAGFPLYPMKFEGVFMDKDKSQFIWSAAECNENMMNAKWEKVGEGFVYYPSPAEIGKRLKINCIPANDTTIGAETEAISTKSVEAGPGICPFDNRHPFTTKRLSGDEFRIVSYNLLADLYCDSDYTRNELFPYCPPYALQIDYRKQLFIKEIIGYNGDIVCLQEVDAKIFNFDLIPSLHTRSYEGLFVRKGKDSAEGLACFYRSDRFRLIEEESCLLGELLRTPLCSEIYDTLKDNEAFLKRFEERTTTLHRIALQSLDNDDEILLIANTHLYFHPNADHVRLMQGGVAILWLNNYAEQLKTQYPNKRISLIFCGDFNTVPSCGIYQLYTTGFVPDDCIDWKSKEDEAVSNVALKQPTQLKSACGTPKYTNFTVGFADCLDYIFYDSKNFAVSQVIPLPSEDELTLHTALPSVVFPSDHMAIVADLKLKK